MSKLENFKGFNIDIDFDRIAKEHAEHLAEEINANISRQGWEGDYANSWGVTKRQRGDKTTFIVHSSAYRLSHLLENGHLIVNKNGGVGWSAPRKHIKPAVDNELPSFYRDVENIKINLKEE